MRSSGKPYVTESQVVWPMVPIIKGRRTPHKIQLKATVVILPAAKSPLTFDAMALKKPAEPTTYMNPSINVSMIAK